MSSIHTGSGEASPTPTVPQSVPSEEQKGLDFTTSPKTQVFPFYGHGSGKLSKIKCGYEIIKARCLSKLPNPGVIPSNGPFGPFQGIRTIADSCVPDMSNFHPVEYLGTTVLVSETSYGYFVKPTRHHFKSEFEIFFGFGCGNNGYSSERVIFVPK